MWLCLIWRKLGRGSELRRILLSVAARLLPEAARLLPEAARLLTIELAGRGSELWVDGCLSVIRSA